MRLNIPSIKNKYIRYLSATAVMPIAMVLIVITPFYCAYVEIKRAYSNMVLRRKISNELLEFADFIKLMYRGRK